MSQIMSDEGRADAINRLSGPSIAVMITGALCAMSSMWGIISGLVQLAAGGDPTALPDLGAFGSELSSAEQEQIQQLASAFGGGVGLLTSFMSLITSGVIIAGGVKMRSAEMYGLSVAAAALCVIPCFTGCCCCLGIPVGVWALVVLLDQNVKAAFR